MTLLKYTRKLVAVLAMSCAFAASAPLLAEQAPEITSDYALLIDRTTGQVLYSRNADERMYPASLTKMMTEIVAIEALDGHLQESVTITSEMLAGLAEANASVAGFAVGDCPTVMDLLYGCALPSGADCVRALAYLVDDNVPTFIERMNAKAAELGMTGTHFVNATGLHDSNHYSTCNDMAKLVSYCLQNDTFLELIGTSEYLSSPVTSHPQGLYMRSTVWSGLESISASITGFMGGKTGYTVPAGRCLASASCINGMDLILISGHSDGVGALADARDLYQWAEDSYAREDLVVASEELATLTVIDGKEAESVSLISHDTYTTDIAFDADINIEVDLPGDLEAPITKDTPIGEYRIVSDGEQLYTGTLYASQSVSHSLWKHIRRVTKAWINKYGISLVVGIIIFIILRRWIILSRRKKKRRRRKRSTV